MSLDNTGVEQVVEVLKQYLVSKKSELTEYVGLCQFLLTASGVPEAGSIEEKGLLSFLKRHEDYRNLDDLKSETDLSTKLLEYFSDFKPSDDGSDIINFKDVDTEIADIFEYNDEKVKLLRNLFTVYSTHLLLGNTKAISTLRLYCEDESVLKLAESHLEDIYNSVGITPLSKPILDEEGNPDQESIMNLSEDQYVDFIITNAPKISQKLDRIKELNKELKSISDIPDIVNTKLCGGAEAIPEIEPIRETLSDGTIIEIPQAIVEGPYKIMAEIEAKADRQIEALEKMVEHYRTIKAASDMARRAAERANKLFGDGDGFFDVVR